MGTRQQKSKSSDAFSTAVSQTTPQTFHLFPNLPPELQDVIWALALPRGRLHVLSGSQPDSNAPPTEGVAPPAVARACRAARAAALRCHPERELVVVVVAARGDGDTRTRTRTATTTQTTEKKPSVWFDGARDILLIDNCYLYHGRVHRHAYAALFAAAETVAVSEEHLLGREPRHSGFLADLVQGSGGSRGAGRLFPRLRRVLVITTRVLVAPQGWPRNWGLCGDSNGGGGGSGGGSCPYPYHVIRPFRAPESFAIDILAPTEARLLKLLRIAHARWSLRARSSPAEVEGEMELGVIEGGGGGLDARDEEEGEGETWGLPIDHYSDSGNDDDNDDGDNDVRLEPLTRDHTWVRKRWDRLPQFVQAISVKDRDTGEVVCKSTSWEDLV